MDDDSVLVSEEDVRTKVVYGWLADHGFSPQDISVEFSFELRLGRGVYKVNGTPIKQLTRHPRADILVRTHDGQNLIVIEVKAPNEPLNDEVREQGISYARLLRKGGVAPFVILTNGSQTKIYDSLSEELISEQQIPVDHKHARNGYRVTGDDLSLKAKTLERFLALNTDNLIAFCRAQVEYRMQRLRDEDPFSGKKYIPTLYVEREEALKQLNKHLEEGVNQVVTVVGSPQVGKTSFICHTVEKRLAAGQPCLFYPAIRMGAGLLKEIQEDFEWELGETGAVFNIIHYKLATVLEKLGEQLVIFIDGLNEPTISLVQEVDKDCERLGTEKSISFVVSFINTSASRLLKDQAGNLSYLAESSLLNEDAVDLLTTSPQNLINSAKVVYLDKYNLLEREIIYKTYSQVYQVKVPTSHQKSNDPFLIRVGMQEFSNRTLPETLDEPTLLSKFIERKTSRLHVGNLSSNRVYSLINSLGAEMFQKDAPIDLIDAIKLWGIEDIPEKLFDIGLLAKVTGRNGLPAVDFYSERERDFVIAFNAQNWATNLLNIEKVKTEFSLAIKTIAGQGALRWFLNTSVSVLQLSTENYVVFEDPNIKRIILTALLNNYDNLSSRYHALVAQAVREAIKDNDFKVRVEAVKLLPLCSNDEIKLYEVLEKEPNLLLHILEIEEKHPVESEIGSVLRDVFDILHQRESLGFEESSISDLLIRLQQNSVFIIRSAAIKLLGHISPDLFLKELNEKIILGEISRSDPMYKIYVIGLELAVKQYEEMYYGDSWGMCPSYLYDNLRYDSELRHAEYMKMYELSRRVIKFFYLEKIVEDLCKLLNEIYFEDASLLDSSREDGSYMSKNKISMADVIARRYQLLLPFQISS